MTNTILKNQGTGASEEARKQAKLGRRALLRKAMVASGVIAGAHFLPEKWFRPLVELIVVPVHAQTSGDPETPTTPPTGSVKFVYSEALNNRVQTFAVPAGVTRLTVEVIGGKGGGGGGGGGVGTGITGGNGGNGWEGQRELTTILVTPGETLTIQLGLGGAPGNPGIVTPGLALGAGGAGGAGNPSGADGGDGGLGAGGGGGAGGTTRVIWSLGSIVAEGGSGGEGGGYNDGSGPTTGGSGGSGYPGPFREGGQGGTGGTDAGGIIGAGGSNGEVEISY
jgi:hypothetical protein